MAATKIDPQMKIILLLLSTCLGMSGWYLRELRQEVAAMRAEQSREAREVTRLMVWVEMKSGGNPFAADREVDPHDPRPNVEVLPALIIEE